MNIDVTVVGPDERTWSEKFTDVNTVEERDGTLHILVDNNDPTGEPELHAMFFPGSWHSWRRTS